MHFADYKQDFNSMHLSDDENKQYVNQNDPNDTYEPTQYQQQKQNTNQMYTQDDDEQQYDPSYNSYSNPMGNYYSDPCPTQPTNWACDSAGNCYPSANGKYTSYCACVNDKCSKTKIYKTWQGITIFILAILLVIAIIFVVVLKR